MIEASDCRKSSMCMGKFEYCQSPNQNFISNWIFIYFSGARASINFVTSFSSIYVLSIYHAYQHLHISSIFPASISTHPT